MDFQSDVVSGTMGEVLAIALFFDVVSGCAVYVAESCTRFCSFDTAAVGFFDDRIDFLCLFAGFSDKYSSCHISTVSVDKASHIQDYRIAITSFGIVCFMMRICCMGAVRDDRLEGMSLGTVFQIDFQEFFSQLRFCHSFAYKRDQFFDTGIVTAGCHTHLLLLFFCFDLADMIYDRGCITIHISHLKFHQAKQEPRRPGFVDTDGSAFSHMGSQNFHTVIGIIKVYDFDSQFFFILRKQLSDHQYRLFFHIQSENHHTFSTCIILSGQIIHSHRICHKKLFQIHLAHVFDYFFYSCHVHFHWSFLFALGFSFKFSRCTRVSHGLCPALYTCLFPYTILFCQFRYSP